MKNIKIMALFLFCFSIFSNAQQWSNEVGIFYSAPNTKIESCANKDGIHIISSKNGGIKYGLINTAGTVIRQNITIESENSGSDLARIVSDNDILYVFYIKNGDIKVARSTNLGLNWSTGFSYIPLVNTECSSLSVVVEADNKIHIAWSERRTGSWYFDSHYYEFNPISNPPSWNKYSNLTDIEQYGGDRPSLTFSNQKIHCSYRAGYPGATQIYTKSRERLKTSTNWDSPQFVPFSNYPMATAPNINRVYHSDGLLNVIYRADVSAMYDFSYIGHSYRNVGGSFWNQNDIELGIAQNKGLYQTQTADNSIHVIYNSPGQNPYIHKKLSELDWSSSLGSITFYTHIQENNTLSSAGNNLYLILDLATSMSGTLPLQYRHYDAAPLTPESFDLSIHQSQGITYPKLTWLKAKEPDVYGTSQAYYLERRLTPGSSSFSQIAVLSGSVTEYIDYSVSYAGSGMHKAEYRIRAKDLANNFSPYSAIKSVQYGDAFKLGHQTDVVITDYELGQNYPNPFNPRTNIEYKIKDGGFVQLKVYDVLGTEVAVLVNEAKEEGIYNVEFNADNLPGGVYIYSLRVSPSSGKDFIQSNKMILLK